jgi:biotin carboxylase
MTKRILIINLGWEQQPLINSLLNRGYMLYGVSNDISLKRNDFEDILNADYRDLQKILEYATKIKPDAIISDQCDYSHYVQAYLCDRLGLKGPSFNAAQTSSNKFVQRKTAKNKGILIPKYDLIVNFDEAIKSANEIGFPLIIKPIDNRGSFGVSKVNNTHELKDAYYYALENSHSRFVIIEEFIDGYEITVDGYCFNGVPKSLAVALKSKEGLSSQVSMDIKYPANIPDAVYEEALRNNEIVASSLGYNFGMIHSEYIVDDQNKIYLVESANRGGGVFTSELIVPKVSGIDVLNCYIDDAVGIHRLNNLPNNVARNEVILKFFAFKNGKIKSIQGLDKITNAPGVLACRLNIKVGDTIKTIDNDGSRHGFVIYHSQKDLRSEVAAIINMIKIEYENE